MKNRTQVYIPYDKIAEFSQRWKIREVCLFGSVLRPDFGSGSDIDVLVTFEPEAQYGLFDIVRMEDELKEILGRDVDLIDRKSVEESRNYIRRHEVLEILETIYVQR